MPFIGKQPQTGAYSKLDAITTSATATYNLTLDGSAYYPQSANHLLVSLNGVMQAPQDSFTISGSQITFASALTSSDSIDFIMALGDTLDIGVPSDGSVVTGKLANSAVTAAKIGSGAVEGAMVTPFGRRNLIVNGDLEVNQRAFTTRTLQSGSGNGVYNVDRWKIDWSLDGNVTAEIVNDAPSGFNKSMKFTVNTASTDSMANSEYHTFAQRIEDRNLQHLGYGTSDAKKITLSFWVKANHTATYSAGFRGNIGTTKGNHQSYTINAVDTWEYKTLTFNPDTSAAFSTNDGSSYGLELHMAVSNGGTLDDPTDDGNWDTGNYIGLHSGVTMGHFNDTVGNTIQLTGFQLEVGEVATPFEKRSYGEELQLCQRYYERFGQGWWARFESGSQLVVNGQFKVEKRTAPTIGLPVGGTIRLYEWGVSDRDTTPTLTSTAMAANGGHFKLSGFSTGGSTGEIWGVGGTPTSITEHPFEAIAEL